MGFGCKEAGISGIINIVVLDTLFSKRRYEVKWQLDKKVRNENDVAEQAWVYTSLRGLGE